MYRLGTGRNRDQRVRAYEGGQSGRRLRPGRRYLQTPLGVNANDTPLKLDAIGGLNIVIEPHSSPRPIYLGRTEHAAQCGSDKHFKSHECGYGIARQTEYQGVSRGSKVERLPRFHEYTTKMDPGELREQRLDEIEISHGHAAARN